MLNMWASLRSFRRSVATIVLINLFILLVFFVAVTFVFDFVVVVAIVDMYIN